MSRYERVLAELAAAGLRRDLREIGSAQGPRIRLAGRDVLSLCSNNYLGLANHPHVIAAVQEAVRQWGWGAGASRLVSGHMSPHGRFEERLARFKRTQAALVLPSGYQANLAAIRGAAGPGDVVLLDKLDHASIIDAALGSGAEVRVFPHRNYGKLRRLLDRSGRYRSRVIITDTLFSMDGDLADLKELVEIKRHYEATLCIDEAHATGVFGAGGRGLAEHVGAEADVDIVVGTLSKALGGVGGFVCGRRDFIDCLVNVARAFVYTTAVPPAVCAAAEAALDIVEREPERRRRLLAMSDELRSRLQADGFEVGDSASQIIPVILGEPQQAVRLSQALLERGFFVPAIRPPSVPRGTARLRVSLCSEHSPDELRAFSEALADARSSIYGSGA